MTTLHFPLMTLTVFLTLACGIWTYDVAFCRQKHRPLTFKEASLRSVLYIAVALGFGGYLAAVQGTEIMSLYLSGYIMEKVLSIDNLIVFAAVFAYFRIPLQEQPWILQYGILGAMLFRLLFITVGVGALYLFGRGTELIFGGLVAWSAWGLYQSGDSSNEVDYENCWYVRLAKKLSVHPGWICLVAIEITDVLFAFDSVPAVIAITQDPLLIFTAMMFAILGLRALYFVLASLRPFLVYLDKAVIIVLLFIAAKLIGHAVMGWHLSPVLSCFIVISILGVGVLSSLMKPMKRASV